MAEMYHPPITVGNLRAVLQALDGLNKFGDTEYLLQSPWSDDIKDMLLEIVNRRGEAGENYTGFDEEDLEELASEIDASSQLKHLTNLQQKMRQFERSLSRDNHKEKVAMFRMNVSLSEKIIDLLERAAKVKEIKEFKEIVFSTMSEYLDDSQKTIFSDRIAHHLEEQQPQG